MEPDFFFQHFQFSLRHNFFSVKDIMAHSSFSKNILGTYVIQSYLQYIPCTKPITIDIFIIGSRPESSEGEPPQYQPPPPPPGSGQQQPPMLDPMAISMMPPEFECPPSSNGSRIQELKQRLERSRSGVCIGADDAADSDGSYAPKGSLV